jgi:hypothetical protein
MAVHSIAVLVKREEPSRCNWPIETYAHGAVVAGIALHERSCTGVEEGWGACSGNADGDTTDQKGDQAGSIHVISPLRYRFYFLADT